MGNTPKVAFFTLILLSICTLLGWLNASYALALGLLLGWFSNANYQTLEAKQLNTWASWLLKFAIVALGLTLPIGELVNTAQASFWLTLGVIAGTMLLGLGLAKTLKLNPEQGLLISSGTAICGGSAIAAVGSSIKANQTNMVLSLAIVFILNAIALFIFPIIGNWLELSQTQFGLWAAIGIHDTSSVVGAASQYGEEALAVATTTKLSRALWIIPIALLAVYFNSKSSTQSGQKANITIPWFILLFIIASIVGSYIELGEMGSLIKVSAKNIFALSLLWMGASLNKTNLMSISPKAMSLGLFLWLVVSVVSLMIIYHYY